MQNDLLAGMAMAAFVALVGTACAHNPPVAAPLAPESRAFSATDRELFSAVLTSARAQDFVLEIADGVSGWVVARTPAAQNPLGLVRAHWYFSIKEGELSLRVQVSVEKQGRWVPSALVPPAQVSELSRAQLARIGRLLSRYRRPRQLDLRE